MRRMVLLCGVSLVGILMAACAPSLISVPARTGTGADGQLGEWGDAEFQQLGESSLTISLQHGEDSLFVYLATGSTETLKRLSRLGLTIWFDDKDDEQRMSGVRFTPSAHLLTATASSQRARELRLEHVGLWPPAKRAPSAFEGAEGGLWFAELQLPLEPTDVDDVRLAIESRVPPTSAGQSRGSVTTTAPIRARRPRTARNAARHTTAQRTPATRKTDGTKRIWFDIEGL